MTAMDPGTRKISVGMVTTWEQAREQIAALPPEVAAALDSWLAAQRAADEATAGLKKAARRARISGIEYLAFLAKKDQEGGPHA
jgi:hypothetical protein